MDNTLTGSVQRLIQCMPVGQEAVSVKLLFRILKYSDDDRALAYCMGLYLKSYPVSSPAAVEAVRAIGEYVQANELSYYFGLEERPVVEVTSVLAVLIAALGFSIAFFSSVSFLNELEPTEPITVTLSRFISSLTVFLFAGLFIFFASLWKIVHNRRRALLIRELEGMCAGYE